MNDHYRLIVQAHLLEAVRPGLAGVWAAHHADDEGDLGVSVLGVGQGAGLHDVPVALGSSVLALELVTALNLSGLTGRSGQLSRSKALWSTLIGRGSTRLGSHWSRVLLRQHSYAIKNQLVASKVPTRGFLLAPRWFFMA